MRCPKCGYNSFDHLDSCKKCGKDLTEHKARFNIRSILLSEMPLEATSTVAEEAVAAATAVPDVAIDDFAAGGGGDADDFGFDFMGDSEDEENLAFDELFEEVPTEDEVEETLPAPDAAAAEGSTDEAQVPEPESPEAETAEQIFDEPELDEPIPLDQELAAEEPATRLEEATADDFSFDDTEPAEAPAEPVDITENSSADFGFDAEEDPDADIFAETEEDFSLDAIDPEKSDPK